MLCHGQNEQRIDVKLTCITHIRLQPTKKERGFCGNIVAITRRDRYNFPPPQKKETNKQTKQNETKQKFLIKRGKASSTVADFQRKKFDIGVMLQARANYNKHPPVGNGTLSNNCFDSFPE